MGLDDDFLWRFDQAVARSGKTRDHFVRIRRFAYNCKKVQFKLFTWQHLKRFGGIRTGAVRFLISGMDVKIKQEEFVLRRVFL